MAEAPLARVPMLSDLQEKKLTRYFQVYDIDDDGQIAASDFARVIDNVRILRGASESSPASNGLRSVFMSFWTALSDSADSDRDGGIDLDEWLAYGQVALDDDARYEAEVEAITDHLFTVFDNGLRHRRGRGNRSGRVRGFLRRVRAGVESGAQGVRGLGR